MCIFCSTPCKKTFIFDVAVARKYTDCNLNFSRKLTPLIKCWWFYILKQNSISRAIVSLKFWNWHTVYVTNCKSYLYLFYMNVKSDVYIKHSFDINYRTAYLSNVKVMVMINKTSELGEIYQQSCVCNFRHYVHNDPCRDDRLLYQYAWMGIV